MRYFSHHERAELTCALVTLLDSWGVRDIDKVRILGLPASTRVRMFKRYRQGTALPLDKQVLAHVDHLLGIVDALQTTYPRNTEIGSYWMNKPNRRFQNRTPISLLIDDGLSGLRRVRAHLDCTYAWDRSGSKA
jgi:uncharacterized protein (DUF2384 family)